MAHNYDVIIIGAGTGGLSAATFGRQLGVKIALIEKQRIGGDCTWTGCVPSKALIRVAKSAYEARTASRFGVQVPPPVVDMSAVYAHIHTSIETIYHHETPEALAAQGITALYGTARFADAHTLMLNDRPLRAKRYILATGARPHIPNIEGLRNTPFLTYEAIFELKTLPKHLIIIGAGAQGAEIGQAYARLGAAVTLIDPQGLLSAEIPEARAILSHVFAQEGIRVLQASVDRVAHDGTEFTISAGGQVISGDVLLVATGRTPNVEGIGLDQAGVSYSERGIQVNARLQTSTPHIYAVGDCTGAPQYTHLAGYQGFAAICNALLPLKQRGMPRVVPRAIFTDPEVAHVGMSEAEARAQHGDSVRTTTLDMNRTDRAITDDDARGLIKIVYRSNGAILGATLVAARAAETLTEFTLAIERGLKAGDLATAIHLYPTYATAAQLALADVTSQSLLGGWLGRVARWYANR
jgi:pyruvate/2-oxoglutarate dehydrogenase complex dihydrolipoamide dehydrogenase (E3) component